MRTPMQSYAACPALSPPQSPPTATAGKALAIPERPTPPPTSTAVAGYVQSRAKALAALTVGELRRRIAEKHLIHDRGGAVGPDVVVVGEGV